MSGGGAGIDWKSCSGGSLLIAQYLCSGRLDKEMKPATRPEFTGKCLTGYTSVTLSAPNHARSS